MTTPDAEIRGDCPSWTKLARFVAEGGPWPAEHLRTCAKCSERRKFLESLSAEGFSDERVPVTDIACPDVMEVIAVAEGVVTSDERLRVVEHFSSCEACGALFKELLALSDAGGLDREVRDAPVGLTGVTRRRRRERRAFDYRLAGRVAAVVVLVLALAAVLLVPFPIIETGVSDRWRGLTPGLEATLDWPENAAFPTIRADAFVGADSYRVSVWSERGDQLLEAHRTAAEPLSLSLQLSSDVSAGQVVFWQVDVLELGEVTSSSGPRRLSWRGR